MNFGSVSPSGIQLITSQSFLPSKVKSSNSNSRTNAKLNMRGFLDLPNSSKSKSILNSKIVLSTNNNGQPIIIGGTKNLAILEALHQHNQNNLSGSIHGHDQSTMINCNTKNYKLYGSNEDINEKFTMKNNNYTKNGMELMGNSTNNSNYLTISNSRVPDIQMINKYYGLIPKKFTMHSRHSADQHNRGSKSGGTKLRAKSALTLISGKKSSLDEPSGPEYNDPLMKVALKGRRGSATFDNMKGGESESEIGDKSSSSSSSNDKNHVGLVTAKKMSVEKHNKKLWRTRRSSSLSSLEGMKGGGTGTEVNCHASKNNNKCEESYNTKEAQRVIKIDLNNMSWEESYQSYSPSEELYSPLPSDNPKNGSNYLYNDEFHTSNMDYSMKNEKGTTTTSHKNNFNISESTSVTCPNGPLLSLSLSSTTTAYDHGGCGGGVESYNNGSESRNDNNNHAHQSGNQVDRENTFVPFAQMQNANTQKALQNNDNGFNLDSKNKLLFHPQIVQVPTPVVGESSTGLCGLQANTNANINTNSTNGSGNIMETNSSVGVKRGRLRKTISFDEQILRQGDTSAGISGSNGKPNTSEAPKARRPVTASTRLSSINSNNNASQPPKVLPWTQRPGQSMSLAERRSKFQKSFSIHSSDSFDYGDGEGSDIETDSTTLSSTKSSIIPPGPNSSAYKETRKALFFQPPPEVHTMVSQISPIDNLEIQCEIEKVAVMLKNMQNQNKSFIDLSPAANATTVSIKNLSSSSPGTSTFLKSNPNSSKNDNEFPNDTTRDINGNPAGDTTSIYSVSTITNDPNSDKPILMVEDVGVAKTKTSMKMLSPSFLAEGPDKKNCSNNDCKELEEKDNFIIGKEELPAAVSNKHQCTVVTSLVNDISGTGIGIKDKNPIDTKTIDACITNPTGVCGGGDTSVISCIGSDPVSLKVQSQSGPILAKRPPLRKSVSISCEKELFGTSASCQNEVNGNGHESNFIINGNKGSRPKTAASTGGVPATSKTFLRSSSLTIENSSQRTRSIVSNSTNANNHHYKPSDKGYGTNKSLVTNEISSSNQSQALRNRKILIKKALIEINQSAAQLGKKWGTLGRPKTAPNNNSSSGHNGNSSSGGGNGIRPRKPSATVVMTCGQNQKRQPLKASPQTLSSGVKPGNPVGKGVTPNLQSSKRGESGQDISEAEAQKDDDQNMTESSPGSSGNRRTLHRQSFSLDEGMLLGFSNKEFGWSSSLNEVNGDSSAKSQAELSFLSSTKREECLKIYEKMMKTGLAVKLDTIFRGMMTPSEYRAFIKAAEHAAREAAEAAAEEEAAKEDSGNAVDAGVIPPTPAVATEQSEVIN